MPFTLCHTAVAYPLARRHLVLSAVVVGCMAPDFEFFLRLSLLSRWGHTLPGALAMTLPAALATLWMFHAVLKRPLIALAPRNLQLALAPYAGEFPFLPAKRLVQILASLAIGILSHIALDTFTHKTDWGVRTFGSLHTLLPLPFTAGIPIYRILQHAATVVLGLFLARQCLRWARSQKLDLFAVAMAIAFGPAVRVLLALLLPAAVLGLIYADACSQPVHNLRTFQMFGGRAFCATGTAVFLEFLGFALIQQMGVISLKTPDTAQEEQTQEVNQR